MKKIDTTNLIVRFWTGDGTVPCAICNGVFQPPGRLALSLAQSGGWVCYKCGEQYHPILARDLERLRYFPEEPDYKQISSEVESELDKVLILSTALRPDVAYSGKVIAAVVARCCCDLKVLYGLQSPEKPLVDDDILF
jgi:hypothetical protein